MKNRRLCRPAGIIIEGVRTFYLKLVRYRNNFHYILRETYLDQGVLKFRDLMDLGPNPSTYVHYPGGNGFYFSPIVEKTLREKGVEVSSDDLEMVFRPFLDPWVRTVINRHQRAQRPRTRVPCDLEDLVPGQRNVHLFDARRLYYLRFGRMDSGELAARRWKFLDIFLCKSRDEIESIIAAMERELRPSEYATYVYAALGVQLRFPQYVREYPAALHQAMVDAYVLEGLCRMDADKAFFLGVERNGDGGGLHPYLTKYAWLYFDFEFQVEIWDEAFGFGNRMGQQPAPRPALSLEQACLAFGISAEDFTKMTRKELIRIYRRKAKKMHPDKGGDHEDFVKLSKAYEHLLALKK